MTDPKEDIAELADEYVLGLLDATEAEAVSARIETDAALRAAVASSQERFLELDLATAPAAPVPDTLWGQVQNTIDAGGPTKRTNVVALSAAGASTAQVRSWRRRAGLALAASVMLAVGLGWSLATRQTDPKVVAILLDAAGEPVAMIEDFGDDTAQLVMLTDFDIPQERVIEVWTKPSEDIGPVSLGTVTRSASARLAGPDLPAPRTAQLYEITLEVAGGSPTGLPTGPILGKGFAKAPR